jgi:hypothetical protein
MSSRKVNVILVENSQMCFVKICPLEAELFHADGKIDMTNLTVVFRNFANATKMTNTVITLVPTFKTTRHVLGHSLVRVITSYTHTTVPGR